MVIYLLKEDAELLAKVAEQLRFKSRSEMIAAILERLILGGFALIAWIKTGLQFQKRFDRYRKPEWPSFYFGIEQFPALPEEKRPSPPIAEGNLSDGDFRGVIDQMREDMDRAESGKEPAEE